MLSAVRHGLQLAPPVLPATTCRAIKLFACLPACRSS
jgi:hypothetical protein